MRVFVFSDYEEIRVYAYRFPLSFTDRLGKQATLENEAALDDYLNDADLDPAMQKIRVMEVLPTNEFETELGNL